MDNHKISQVKMAFEYLDSFIECEQLNKANCNECGGEILGDKIIPFNEAIKALELLKSALDIN